MMKYILAVTALIFSASPALSMGQHYWDMSVDSEYWRQRPSNAECPGQHLESIWYKDHGHAAMRACVDTKTLVRLPNGNARARFVDVYYAGENSKIRGGKHFTSYSSQYRVVNCSSGEWNADRGYKVQNKPSEWYLPLEDRPGWFIFSDDGIPGRYPKKINHSKLSLKYGGIDLTRVDHEVLYLCPNIQG